MINSLHYQERDLLTALACSRVEAVDSASGAHCIALPAIPLGSIGAAARGSEDWPIYHFFAEGMSLRTLREEGFLASPLNVYIIRDGERMGICVCL